jgi:hypothetical protein
VAWLRDAKGRCGLVLKNYRERSLICSKDSSSSMDVLSVFLRAQDIGMH